ncbi:MAG: XRE family transcriptional regulator [Bacteroidota bacterium]
MIDDNQIVKLIFGFKVRYLRTQQGLSFQQLQEKTGLALSYLSDIEKGKKYPKPNKITLLAEAFGVDYDFMVSMNASKKLQPIIDLLNSNFFKLFPLDEFGISPKKLVELFTNTPDRVNAFIRTIFQIQRNYQIKQGEFYEVALRAYQDMHNNYFDFLEKAVTVFKEEYGTSSLPYSSDFLEAQLNSVYGISVDRTTLPTKKTLKNIRSLYVPGTKCLMINEGLETAQENFLLARELGFQHLQFKVRPYETRMVQTTSFEKLLNNFFASYFAVALLVDETELVKDFQQIIQKNTWRPELFLALMAKYDVTQETLLKRLMNILPRHFGIEELFFQRMTGSPDLKQFKLSQALHLGQLHNPYGNLLNEHYCHRWVAVKILKKLRMDQTLTPDIRQIVDVQISKYWETNNEYLCITLAKPDFHNPKASVSATIGFKLNTQLRAICNFINDPDLKQRIVNATCERCSMPNCDSRVAAPVVIEKERELATMKAELKALGR